MQDFNKKYLFKLKIKLKYLYTLKALNIFTKRDIESLEKEIQKTEITIENEIDLYNEL